MAIDAGDGVIFEPASLQAGRIREEPDHGGLRLRGSAELGGARIAIVIDIAFGDSVEPGLESIDYPSLLDQPSPRLRAYAPETVVAEKFQAVVALGRANSRMKDFYDVWALFKTFTFDPERLARAIAATFARRTTAIPQTPPVALTESFATDPAKQRQWTAFAADIADAPRDLVRLIAEIAPLLMTAAQNVRTL